jgi:hypothetical protein
VYFGRARFQNGVLVEPQAGAYVDPANEEELSAFRNKIWPYVEEANAFAPSHSRVFKGGTSVLASTALLTVRGRNDTGDVF